MSPQARKSQRSALAKIVYVFCVVNGLCAVFFGGLMMIFPLDTPLGLGALLPHMGNFPFQQFFETLFWSGLALALCNGVCNLIASWFFLRSKDAWALPFALAAGILMVIWDVYEFIFLPNPLAIVFGIIGAAQTVMSFLLIRQFDPRKDLFA